MGRNTSLMDGRLTKKFLMGLPEGLYLVSNMILGPDKSIFSEKVAPLSEREEQWKRIAKVGADQRLCYVYRTEDDYQAHLKERLNGLKWPY